MYNRYVPQHDGSFRRNSVPDPPSQPRREPQRPGPQKNEPRPQPACDPPPKQESNRPLPPAPRPGPCRGRQCPPVSRRESCAEQRNDSVGSFFKSLLPKDFDTGDLLVVLLLLLMAGDCKEDQNSALLTLVLYLYL